MARRRHAGWGKSIPHLWTSSETRSGEVKCHLGCAATANRAGMGNAAVRAGRARGMREAGGHLGSLRGVECRLHHTCCGPAAEDESQGDVRSALGRGLGGGRDGRELNSPRPAKPETAQGKVTPRAPSIPRSQNPSRACVGSDFECLLQHNRAGIAVRRPS